MNWAFMALIIFVMICLVGKEGRGRENDISIRRVHNALNAVSSGPCDYFDCN